LEIKQEYAIRTQLWELAKARERDPTIQAHYELDEKIIDKLRTHAGSLTMEQALTMTPQEIYALFGKIAPQDRAAIAARLEHPILSPRGQRGSENASLESWPKNTDTPSASFAAL
jgi:hypothetical protein